MEEIRRVADTNGLAAVPATANGTNWPYWANQNLGINPANITSLANEAITITDLNNNALVNNANPLPVRIRVNWTEKGKASSYVIDTLITQR